MRTMIATIAHAFGGCAGTLTTTPQTREADCRQWATSADAEDARAAKLNGAKGAHTAEVSAKLYRNAIADNCGGPVKTNIAR